MAAYVLQHAGRLRAKPALEIVSAGGKQVWTYAQIDAAVRTVAGRLRAHGIVAGDIVVLRLANTADFPIAYLGCIAIGALPVPLSMQLTPKDVQKITTDLCPRLVLGADGIAVADLTAAAPIDRAEFDMGDPNRAAYMIYTSGTSGTPRAVVHAHRAVWARQMMWDDWYGLRRDDRLLHAGAFNWTYTLGTGLMDPWAIGATALIPAEGTDAVALAALLSEHEATIFAAAPGVYRRILRSDIDAPTLRHGLSAGEALSPHLHQQWQAKTGTKVHEAFGMSECSTFLSGSPKRPAPDGAIGWPQTGRKVALRPEGRPSDTGEIAIHRSDMGLMLGYFGAESETEQRFDGDWFMTGDLGTKGPDGAISYAGRADDMMNAGGYRVSPIEVEAALALHPDITECAACAVQISTDISLIAGFYVSPQMIDPKDLTDFAQSHLAGYKCPRIWVHTDSLPRGANNKLLRRKLREDWTAQHGQA